MVRETIGFGALLAPLLLFTAPNWGPPFPSPRGCWGFVGALEGQEKKDPAPGKDAPEEKDSPDADKALSIDEKYVRERLGQRYARVQLQVSVPCEDAPFEDA
jgi:hypothetical protein